MKNTLVTTLIILQIIKGIDVLAQACPDVYAGEDTTLPCGNNCYFLNAGVSQTGATTSYQVTQIGYQPYSYTIGNTVLLNIDDLWTSPLNLGFNFCFYGNVYNQCVIGSNGLISFDLSYSNSYCQWPINAPIPSTLNPVNSIMSPYHDIDPSVGGVIRYNTYGTAPCRVFVITWYNIPMFDCNNLIATQQIALFETTNVIDTYILNKPICYSWNAGAAIHGIQDQTGTLATVVTGRNYPTQWSASNEGWRFTPAGPSSYTISWYDINMNQIATTDTITVCPDSTSTYIAEVVYTNCDSSQVTVQDSITLSLVANFNFNVTVNNAYCAGQTDGSATVNIINGSSPFTYQWDSNTGNQTSQTATGLGSGTYYVTITDSTGCIKDTAIEIMVTDSVVMSLMSIVDSVCPGESTGSATVSATGGSSPYFYQWNDINNQTTATATGLGAGNYTVIVNDTIGCTDTLLINIGEYDSLVITPASLDSASCYGFPDGQATIGVSGGGGAPYSYQWDLNAGGQTTATATGLAGGDYTVIITDSAGCQDSLIITIEQPLQMLLQSSTTDITCYDGNDGQATVSPSNAPSPYTYEWSNTQTDQTATGLSSGSYTVTVTDDNGCTEEISVVLNNPVEVIADFSVDPQYGIVPMDVVISNNSIGSEYEWHFGDGETYNTSSNSDINHTYGESGIYDITLIVYDDNGCMDSLTITIEVIESSELNVPNVFTPNGDNINDKFVIQSVGISNMHGTIYNRWGRKIYEWEGMDNFWDGSGHKAGVYYYIISAIGVDTKQYNITGYITMIK